MSNKSKFPTSCDRPTGFYNQGTKLAVYVVSLGFLLWSFQGVGFDIERFIKGVGPLLDVISRSWPPAFGPRQRSLIISGMIESIGIAFLATSIGVVVSIPFSVLAAKNLVPRVVYYPSRLIVILSRTFHPLILGILFVKAVGVGPFAGILTFVTGTVGYWSKLMAEDIEDMDEKPVKATRAVGANRLQVILYSVVPQIKPRAVAITIYRWDSNIRASTVVGIVGAGGIGLTLINAYGSYDYDFTLAILLTIIAVVLVGEGISAYIRGRIQQ